MKSNEELRTELKRLLKSSDIETSTDRIVKSRLAEAIRVCSLLRGESAYDREKLSDAVDWLEQAKTSEDRLHNIAEALWNIENHAK